MKYRILSLLALAGMLFSSCVKENLSVEGGSILAVMENDDTKTSVTDAGAFTWSEGDEIWLHTEAGSIVGTLSSGAGTSSANFSYGAAFGDMTGKAVCPYNSEHSISGDVLSVVMPSSYDLGSNLTNTNVAMYGVVSDGRLKFNHLAGVMRFKFKNVPAGVNKFTITLDKKINGTFTADLTEAYPVIESSEASTASEKTITLNFNALTKTSDISLYVPLPLGTYNTLELGLYAGNQSVWTHSNKVTNIIDRKTLKLMPVVLLGGSIGGDIEGGDSVDGETGEDDSVGGDTDAGAGENDVGPATVTIGKKTATSVIFDVHMDVPAEELHYCKVTIYYAKSDDIFQIATARSVCAPYVGDKNVDDNCYFDENRNISIPVRQLYINNQYKYCVCVETKIGKFYSDINDLTPGEVTMDLSVDEADMDCYSAVVKGVVTGVFPEDKSYWQYLYVRYRFEGSEDKDVSINISDIPESNIVEFKLENLLPETTYTYMPYYYGSDVSGVEKSFTTPKYPYDIQSDLDFSFATDLSFSSSANCYIVSEEGLYKFKAVKGNSDESVGSIASASILWETFGTAVTPEYFDLIKAVDYENGYIAFQTSDTFKEGNAVIAAKDASGTILWSWHIWLTDQPEGQVYYNNAGTMMDRNLGATSATPGDVGALGLLYQWGRKDPFLGSSSISSSTLAESTLAWPSAVTSNSSNGTIAYATANPTTFITYNNSNYDWCYTGDSSIDNTRWTTSETTKSVYDPCPSGWRVPDGGSNGVWSKAKGSLLYFDHSYDSINEGMNFSGKFGSVSTIWYPASGSRSYSGGSLSSVGSRGIYWSASPYSSSAYSLYFGYDGYVGPSNYFDRAYGQSVRCLQVIDEVAEP